VSRIPSNRDEGGVERRFRAVPGLERSEREGPVALSLELGLEEAV
jgi:hypothetical protein